MTERKRANGFALMDAAFAADAKFVRLARRATDPVAFAASVGVFWLILADCRRAKSPDVDWDDYTEYASQVAALRDAKLLTDEGFDPDTFERWAPAYRPPDRRPNTTNGYEEVPKVRSETIPSGHVVSDQVTSPSEEGGVGGGDAFELAIRMLGYLPEDAEWRQTLDGLEDQYGREPLLEAISRAYRSMIDKGQRPKPWSLVKEVKLLLGVDAHRAERELSNEERVRLAEERRARDDRILADMKRQQDEEFRRRHPDWKGAA